MALLEIGLRVGGYGYPTQFFLPRPDAPGYLTDNPDFGRQFFPPALVREPLPQSLPKTKEPGTIRVILIGESAALGDPEPAFGMGRILEVLLRQTYPSNRIEVVNTAMTAINSHTLLPIAHEAAKLDADFWVVYAGNNEVVGPFGSGTVFGPQVPNQHLIRFALWLKTWKTGQLVDSLAARLKRRPDSPEAWGGMEMFLSQQVQASDPKLQKVYKHFEQNLREMAEAGRRRTQRGAHLLFCTVAVNLRDCAPFASTHRPGWSADNQQRWDALVANGRAATARLDWPEARRSFEEALKLDSEYAETHFLLAECLWAAGRLDHARNAYEKALEYDTLRFRADQQINRIVRQVAAEREQDGIQVVDTAAVVAAASPASTPGREMFWEHVHLNFAGNYQVARAIAAKISKISTPHRLRESTPAWPTMEAVAQQLGFTDWHHAQIVKEMQQRLAQAPFTNQLNHAAQLQHLEALVKRLDTTNLATQAAILRSAAAGSPKDWVLAANQAKLLEAAGDLPGALAECQRAAEMLPHHAPALYRCGDLLYRQNKIQPAMDWYLRAKALKPGAPEIWNGMALCYLSLNQWEAANAHCTEAIRLNPRDPEYHFNHGIILAAQGRHNEAVAVYRQNLAVHPRHRNSYINLGNLLARQNRFDQAEPVFLKLLEKFPGDASAHNNYGSALARQGKLPQAVAQFREAVRLERSHWEARFNLASGLAQMQQYEEAIAQFEIVVAAHPDFELARKRLEQLRRQRASSALLHSGSK